ncbi:hypothetical protein [Amycolatopsis sp. SID8362]|uniref:hypothetical protein n=1 Tax=Amycolatopsis sp. SID8362 TaxID=2690346 RepID=UPI001368C7DF|nr:hypothetical protein [Amycolatopsis sp. SID8362]NBH03089.1 hypothetical protein [Amycolatopsis sp. SID8362]NED39790.1 hypothetical protein [Amycolatopsis sp. SID8362]
MAFPVTGNGSVECDHHGAVSLPAVSDGRLVVAGGKAVLFAGVLTQPYAKCAAPSPPGVCVTTLPSPPDSGRAARLTVGGAPVLLDSLTATSLPSATPVKVAAGQSVLTAS